MRTRFQYITVADFRSRMNVPSSSITDDQIRGALERASKAVNVVTDQFFLPVAEAPFVDGSGVNIITHPQAVPILRADRVTINLDKNLAGQESFTGAFGDKTALLGEEVITRENWEVSESKRNIRLVSFGTFLGRIGFNRIPKGSSNVRMEGVFGWMEPERSYSAKTEAFAEQPQPAEPGTPGVISEPVPVVSTGSRATPDDNQITLTISAPVSAGFNVVVNGREITDAGYTLPEQVIASGADSTAYSIGKGRKYAFHMYVRDGSGDRVSSGFTEFVSASPFNGGNNALSTGSEFVLLDDVSKVSVRDVLVFGLIDPLDTDAELIWGEVVSIDRDNRCVFFEALKDSSNLPVVPGSDVASFGQIPDVVALATASIARNRELSALIGGGSSVVSDDIRSMRTDRFAFTRFAPGQTGGQKPTTGDDYVDHLLQHYAAPPDVMGV